MGKRFSNQRTSAEHKALAIQHRVCWSRDCFERPQRFSDFCSSHRGPLALRPAAQ